MDCGESAGGPALSERFDVTGRLVRFRLCALTQRGGRGYASTFHLTVAVTVITPIELPNAPTASAPEPLPLDASGCIELAAKAHLATPGLRPGDVVRLKVLRDGTGLRVLEMSTTPTTSRLLQGRVCEVRPVRSSSTQQVAIRIDVHTVVGGDDADAKALEIPNEFWRRPWFVGPMNAMRCDVRVGQAVLLSTSRIAGEWRLDKVERRATLRPAVRRTSSIA